MFVKCGTVKRNERKIVLGCLIGRLGVCVCRLGVCNCRGAECGAKRTGIGLGGRQ